MRGVLIAALVLVPLRAMAGTPAEEAARCDRNLTAIARNDEKAYLDSMLDRFKPGETPDRFIRHQVNVFREFQDKIAKQDGIKEISPMPDHIVELTGDIIKLQKWVDGKGGITYAGCVSYSAESDPWNMASSISASPLDTVDDLQRAVTDPSSVRPK